MLTSAGKRLRCDPDWHPVYQEDVGQARMVVLRTTSER
jgi:hypothetical protein